MPSNQTLDAPSIAAVADLATAASDVKGKTLREGDTLYSTVPLHEYDTRPAPARVATREVRTLSGLIGYIETNRDSLPLSAHLLHVVSHNRVELVSSLDPEYKTRDLVIAAVCPDRLAAVKDFGFNRYLSGEWATVGLQALFVDTEARRTVQSHISAIRRTDKTELKDDGVSQTYAAKQGVHIASSAVVPNPVPLKPYRTFNEVDQPPSDFVFRVNADLQVGFWEADGGAWQTEAMRNIAEHLRASVPEALAVIA